MAPTEQPSPNEAANEGKLDVKTKSALREKFEQRLIAGESHRNIRRKIGLSLEQYNHIMGR